jgi:hypothetical protein
MKSFIFIILLFSLFQFSISKRKHYQYEFEEEEININSNIKIDPNDRIDIDLWNQFNKVDIKYAPRSIDYSSEIDATEWLEWYFRIAQRYNQVKF